MSNLPQMFLKGVIGMSYMGAGLELPNVVFVKDPQEAVDFIQATKNCPPPEKVKEVFYESITVIAPGVSALLTNVLVVVIESLEENYPPVFAGLEE